MTLTPSYLPVSFRRLAEPDIDELTTWFEDSALARRISAPDDVWRAYILTDNGVSRSWIGLSPDQHLLCEIQVDRQPSDIRGYINYYIRPSLRGYGLAVPILSTFLNEGPGLEFEGIEASIEPDNDASLRCFQRCGFVDLPEQTEPGMRRLYWDRPT